MTWTRAEGVELATAVEAVCKPLGCHVALTGGLLYKTGPRKDCDLLIYRNRDAKQPNMERLLVNLASIGVVYESGRTDGTAWCIKMRFQGKHIDLFFPEAPDGAHDSGPAAPASVEEDWLASTK